MKLATVTNVEWDAKNTRRLPKQLTLTDAELNDMTTEAIEEYLSDTYEHCVKGFCVDWSEISDDEIMNLPVDEAE